MGKGKRENGRDFMENLEIEMEVQNAILRGALLCLIHFQHSSFSLLSSMLTAFFHGPCTTSSRNNVV